MNTPTAPTHDELLAATRKAWTTGFAKDIWEAHPCIIILWPDTPADARTATAATFRCIKHDRRVADHSIRLCDKA